MVRPMNPAARRNRDRRVVVEGVTGEKDGRVRVRFTDTGRTGYEEPSNLLPLDEA